MDISQASEDLQKKSILTRFRINKERYCLKGKQIITMHTWYVQSLTQKIGILWLELVQCFKTRYKVSGTYSITRLRKSSSLLVVEKKQCFKETTFGWSISRINCSSRFLQRRSCKTFLMATDSPVSKHLAYNGKFILRSERKEESYRLQRVTVIEKHKGTWNTIPNDPCPTTRSAM